MIVINTPDKMPLQTYIRQAGFLLNKKTAIDIWQKDSY